jgi:hypothetical protein
VGEALRDLDAHGQRRLGLVARHGRLDAEVARTGSDLALPEARRRIDRTGDTDVDDDDPDAELTRERVDGGTAGDEVRDHLGRDLLRPGRDPLGVDAVIGGEDGHGRSGGDRRRTDAGDRGEPDGHVLQDAEGTARLGQSVLAGACLDGGDRVARPDRGEDEVEGTRGRHPRTLRDGGRTSGPSGQLIVQPDVVGAVGVDVQTAGAGDPGERAGAAVRDDEEEGVGTVGA